MAYTPVVDEVAIAQTAIGLLTRDVGLASTIWRDPVPPETFARKKNDTVSIYLPAYAVANKRSLRGNAVRATSTLKEAKVDVSLENDLQVDVPLTDENLTLDIENLARQVIAPAMGAIARGYDSEVAAVMSGASYQATLTWDDDNPYETLVFANQQLNDFNVPATGRHLVLGSTLHAELLLDDRLVSAQRAGSTETLRRGVVSMVAGFDSIRWSPFLDADEGYAYHTTAYALCSRAPAVPDGVAWGNVQSTNGFAVRVMQHLGQDDNKDLLNTVYHDSWFGCAEVKDHGTVANGKFTPATAPDNATGSDLVLVRAVKINGAASSGS